MVFILKIFFLFLNELNFLINLLIILVIFQTQVIVEFFNLFQSFLLHFSHPILILIYFSTHFKHIFIFFFVLNSKFFVSLLHLFELISYLLYLLLQSVYVFMHWVVVLSLHKQSLFEFRYFIFISRKLLVEFWELWLQGAYFLVWINLKTL